MMIGRLSTPAACAASVAGITTAGACGTAVGTMTFLPPALTPAKARPPLGGGVAAAVRGEGAGGIIKGALVGGAVGVLVTATGGAVGMAVAAKLGGGTAATIVGGIAGGGAGSFVGSVASQAALTGRVTTAGALANTPPVPAHRGRGALAQATAKTP